MLVDITYGVVTHWVLNIPSQIWEHKNTSITDMFTDDILVYYTVSHIILVHIDNVYYCFTYTLTHTHESISDPKLCWCSVRMASRCRPYWMSGMLWLQAESSNNWILNSMPQGAYIRPVGMYMVMRLGDPSAGLRRVTNMSVWLGVQTSCPVTRSDAFIPSLEHPVS